MRNEIFLYTLFLENDLTVIKKKITQHYFAIPWRSYAKIEAILSEMNYNLG